MTDRISNTMIPQLRELIASNMGLYFPEERLSDLNRGIRCAASDLGFQNVEECKKWLVSSPLTQKKIDILASHLTVGETYLFREKPVLKVLRETIFPELIQSRSGTNRRLRIWSVGCATGEEPYSIAILLDRLIPDIHAWNIMILATDINVGSLHRASKGRYKTWSFRETSPEIIAKYFRKTTDGYFEIIPRIKKLVKFNYLNICKDTYPSLLSDTNAIDMIFCRNVLMYFDFVRQKRAVQSLFRSLVDSGWLVVSPCEASPKLFSQFITVTIQCNK